MLGGPTTRLVACADASSYLIESAEYDLFKYSGPDRASAANARPSLRRRRRQARSRPDAPALRRAPWSVTADRAAAEQAPQPGRGQIVAGPAAPRAPLAPACLRVA